MKTAISKDVETIAINRHSRLKLIFNILYVSNSSKSFKYCSIIIKNYKVLIEHKNYVIKINQEISRLSKGYI